MTTASERSLHPSRTFPALKTWHIVLAFVFLGLVLYVAFPSHAMDGNALVEVQAVDSGGLDLISPNHLLYRPLVYLLRLLIPVSALTTLALAQAVTAVSAALGLGLFYVWVSDLVELRGVALVTTLGFGTSWAYWTFATDAYYITPAAAVALVAIILFTRQMQRPAI